MEINDEKKEAFSLFKIICNSIIKKPSPEHPEQLSQVLNRVESNIVETFLEYVLFPIKLHIFKEDTVNRDDTNCILLECICTLLDHLRIKNEELFMELYSMICFCLVKRNSGTNGKSSALSEELKMTAMKAAKKLFLNATQELLEILYKKKEFYSKLCVLIYNALQFASKEKNIKLRVEALECLIVLCQLNTVTAGKSDLNLDLAKIVKKCLPGLITECRSIVSEGYTQNHKITVLALKVWSKSISLVMADNISIKDYSSINTLEGSFSARNHLNEINLNASSVKDVLKDEELSEEWVKDASKKLAAVTKVFTMLKLHPHYKVRQELVSSVTLILSYAPMNMNHSLGSLLDSLIVLTEDSEETVSLKSKKALDLFKINWSEKRGRLLLEDVKDCLCSLLKRLPRILHGTDENLKESDLILLSGYIQLLGHDHFTEFISSQQLLDKLIVCLLEAATLNTSRISLLEESSLRDFEEESRAATIQWRNFTICHSSKLQFQLNRIFTLLGSMPNLMDMALALLDQFYNSPLKRSELTLIINDIVLSSHQITDDKYSKIIKSIINEYLEPYFWDTKDSVKTSELKASAMQICLCIEGIGKLAMTLGDENFSQYLFKCLYPLLEYVGSPYQCLSQAGIQSIQGIAKTYNGDVSNLIEKNVDYLSHHITIKLKQVQKNALVLYVLSAVMKNSNINTLPSLMEIINNVLIQSCDKFHSNNLNSYLHVFQTFVCCLHSWLYNNKTKFVNEIQEKELINILLEYQTNEEIVENISDTDDTNEDLLDPVDTEENLTNFKEDSENNTKEIPHHIKLTEAILIRSAHFLPSKDSIQQILVMQIIDKGALVLMDYQDILLPVVHKIWSPLVERFDPSKDPLMIKNAFNLLCTLAFTSKDFIRQRSLKHVLPKICILLDKLSKESKLKPHLHGYRFSQKYKLQNDLIKRLGDLAINIDIEGKEIYNLLISCQPYLSSTQPQPLQDACIDLYLKLSKLNRHMVWLHLISLWSVNNHFELKAHFQRKYEITNDPNNMHFSKNVIKILTNLSSHSDNTSGNEIEQS